MMEKPGFEFRAEKPKATSLNKPLVWSLLCVIAILILVVLVVALQSNKMRKEKLNAVHNFNPVVDASVKQLPGSYAGDISKFLPKQAPKIPDAVKQQLQALQREQAALEQRLLALKSKPKPQGQPINTELQNQAMHSGLFFPGASPQKQNTGLAKVATKGAAAPAAGSKGKGALSGYEAQNMQHQKLGFISGGSQDQNDIYNDHSLVAPISPYEVQAGALIPAVLMTAVNTSLPGEVVARVRDNIYNSVTGQFLLIPKGSKLIGQYDSQISYGQRRVLIVFKRIIRPNGTSILLSKSPGADMFGQAGMAGEVNNHWGRVIGSAVLSTILSMGAGAVSDGSSMSSGGTDFYRSSMQNSVLGAAGNISQVGQSLTSRSMNVQPTLTIPTGYEFNIIVNKDMVLQPYQEPVRNHFASGNSKAKKTRYYK